jgi:signal transduction histidine kinase
LIIGRFLIKSVKQVDQQRASLEKANQQQESLMRFINHQVKGFLTRSRTIFDALKSGDYGQFNPEAKNLIDVGFDTNTQAVEMVKSILYAANMREGTVDYAMARFDLRALVSDLFNQLKDSAEKKGLEYNIEIDPNKELFIKGDITHLSQAIRNILENAIQYTDKGSILVSLYDEGNNIFYRVKDTGLGLTEEDRDILFYEGGRGKDAQKINVNSTGYGLFITKKVVDTHGGSINVLSEGRGKGSEFVIKLPLAKN